MHWGQKWDKWQKTYQPISSRKSSSLHTPLECTPNRYLTKPLPQINTPSPVQAVPYAHEGHYLLFGLAPETLSILPLPKSLSSNHPLPRIHFHSPTSLHYSTGLSPPQVQSKGCPIILLTQQLPARNNRGSFQSTMGDITRTEMSVDAKLASGAAAGCLSSWNYMERCRKSAQLARLPRVRRDLFAACFALAAEEKARWQRQE